MSVTSYGAVRFQIQKTHIFSFGPRYTEDGVDYLTTELDLAFTAVVNPMALATSGPSNIAVAAGGAFLEDAPARAPGGDRLGVSLRNLRAMLLTPRQNLTFSINGDQVINITGPDSRNGPLPQKDTYVKWIMGTNTALVYFHVKAWTVDLLPPNTVRRVVLANRYRVSCTTDEDWYARRHIAGQMIIDPSQLPLLAAPGVLTPDEFRQATFLQIPTGFKRENIEVTVSSDNTTLDYSYIDQEEPLALGPLSLATRIEGSASVGIASPLSSLSGMTAALVATGGGAERLVRRGADSILTRLPRAIGGLAATLLPTFGVPDVAVNTGALIAGMGLPKITGIGSVRLWGQRNATKDALAALGINILLDRFSGGFFDAYFSTQGARIGTISVTQDIKERMVEVTATFIATYVAQLRAFTDIAGASIAVQNMRTDIISNGLPGQQPLAANTLAGNPLSGSLAAINPPPPAGGGTRGNWLGALVVSLLGTPGVLPVNAPLDPAVNIDQGSFI